jgi:hypothetical protein
MGKRQRASCSFDAAEVIAIMGGRLALEQLIFGAPRDISRPGFIFSADDRPSGSRLSGSGGNFRAKALFSRSRLAREQRTRGEFRIPRSVFILHALGPSAN